MSKSISTSEFLTHLSSINREELLKVKGIGQVIADNYIEFLDSPRFTRLVKDFEKLESKGNGAKIIINDKPANESKMPTIVCITGIFEISREEIKKKLENSNYKVVETVTKNTSILLAGDKAGSKLSKAKTLNLKIIRDLSEILQP